MRKTIFKLHSYVALFAVIPLIVVSVTGSILVFKTEIDQWLMPDVAALKYEYVPVRRDLNELIQYIHTQETEYTLGSWELFFDGREADRVYVIKKGTDEWYKIYLDPFSSRLLSEPAPLNSYFTDWLLELHYTFLLNNIGGEHSYIGTLLGLFIAIFLVFLGITGLILHKKFWKNLFLLRLDRNLRVFSGDFHRLVGLWTSPVVLVLGLTGLYFNAVGYYHEVFEHPSDEHYLMQAPLYSKDVDFERLLSESRQQLEGFEPTYLLFPFEPEHNITLFGHQPSGNPFSSNYASSVIYDKETGDVTFTSDGREANAAAQTVDSFRELHFGSFAGLLSKVIWSVFGLAPVLLGLSGSYIWYVRNRKTKAVSSTLSTSRKQRYT